MSRNSTPTTGAAANTARASRTAAPKAPGAVEARAAERATPEARPLKTGSAMSHQGEIKEHMDVHAEDGSVLGRVERVEGGTNSIRLARDLATGVHHWIPLAWVQRVNKLGVHLHMPTEQVRETWQESPPHA